MARVELTTPTGAAIVSTLAEPPGGPVPAFVLRGTGYGAGTRNPAGGPPNCLRVLLGEEVPEQPTTESGNVRMGTNGIGRERLLLLETNIDDMNPQLYGWLEETLFQAGAREVFFTPVSMKKGRPGTLVRCLADEQVAEVLADVLFRETSTLGVRSWRVDRRILSRSEETAETSLGSVRVKRVRGIDGREEVRPEYEACRQLAKECGLPLRQVLHRLTPN